MFLAKLFNRSKEAQSSLTKVNILVDHHAPKASIIFVHGLNGDAFSTWQFDRNSLAESIWLAGLGDVLSECRVLSIGYRIASSKRSGGSMPLYERATNVLANLDVHIESDEPIIFVCHSYGGLLVKQILRAVNDRRMEYGRYSKTIKAVVFLSTPHTGSSIANYAKALGVIYGASTAIDELLRTSPTLIDLNHWFRNNFEDLNIKTAVFVEDLKTSGVLVVDAVSGDPGIANVSPVKIDCDHITIAKPVFVDDPRVRRVRNIVRSLFEETDDRRTLSGRTSLQEVLAASNDQLPAIKRNLARALAEDPKNGAAREALDYAESLITGMKEHLPSAPRGVSRSSIRLEHLLLGVALVGVLFVGYKISQDPDWLLSFIRGLTTPSILNDSQLPQ